MNIQTWQEKAVEKHGTTFLPRYDLLAVMQAEIDELRAEIERCTVGWNSANVDVLHHAMTIAAQRKVLGQALEALQDLIGEHYGDRETVVSNRGRVVITAIQEQLK